LLRNAGRESAEKGVLMATTLVVTNAKIDGLKMQLPHTIGLMLLAAVSMALFVIQRAQAQESILYNFCAQANRDLVQPGQGGVAFNNLTYHHFRIAFNPRDHSVPRKFDQQENFRCREPNRYPLFRSI
jgi:hypothetical protein